MILRAHGEPVESTGSRNLKGVVEQ